jgi:hemolysin III
MMMRRADHAAIYGLIAGTYTPLCMLLEEATGSKLLRLVWSGAAAGMIHSFFSRSSLGSKGLSVAIYIALGWIVLPYTGEFAQVLPSTSALLLVGGGVFYSLGAVMYACHWPDLSPTIFGYHEVFHSAVIVAAALHFGGIVKALEFKGLLAN